MKVTKAAAIQCVIMVLVLAAEIVFAGRHRAAYSMEQAAGTGLQEGAEENGGSGLSGENTASGLRDEKGSGNSGLRNGEECGNSGLSEEDGSGVPGSADGETEYVSELGAPEGIVEPAKIVWEEVPVELTGTEFTFGGLYVSLPGQGAWEYREREDGAVSVCLSAEKKFLKKLCFTHYRIEWESRWELILAAMEYFGGDGGEAGWFTFEGSAETERHLGIQGQSGSGKSFCMLVFDGDLYLLEEEEPGWFDFERLCREGILGAEEIGGTISEYLLEYHEYIRRSGKKDTVYLLQEMNGANDQDRILVYQGGNFERPVQILCGDLYVEGDINFDGYVDVSAHDYDLLWSASEKRYVKAVVPSDEYWDKKINDAYQTIWTYHGGYSDQGETERLYQWEGTVLKEIRRITCESREGEINVTLTDAESGDCIASGTFPEKGWQSNEEVRKLYRQFYAGYAPEELYHIRHVAPGKEECVPDSLVKALSEALKDGREEKFLGKLETGRVLSEEEIKQAGEKCAGIAGVVDNMETYGDSVRMRMVRADLDNDGLEDIYAQIDDSGGRMGFADYVLYQGQEDGTYRETGEGSGQFYWSFTALGWEGKKYICRDEVDYDKRIMNGLVLEGYRDGKLAETVSLNLVPGKTETAVLSCQKGYGEMAEKERLKAQEIFEKTEEGHIVSGDAEQETEEELVFSCDIDNDGAEERYKKWFWWPSTTSSISHVEFEIEKETEEIEETEETVIERAISENTEKRGTPIMLWADSYQGENIVNVIYRTDLYDYVVEGYLAEDKEHYRSLYLIEGKTELEVEEVRDWKYYG